GEIADGCAGRIAARAIDRVDRAHLELELPADLLERKAARALVLDLVVQILQFRAGAVARQVPFDLRRKLLERPDALRLHFDDTHQRRAEPAGNRRADLALLEREGRIGDGAVDELGLVHGTEVDVPRLEVAL